MLPDTPTISESGVAGFNANLWQGIVARAGTPRAIVDKINRGLNRVLTSPEIKDRIVGLGEEVIGGTPDQLARIIMAEIELWARVLPPELKAQ